MPPKRKRAKTVPPPSDEASDEENSKNIKKKGVKNPAFINWKESKARSVVIEDLVAGRMPLDDAFMSAESAWDVHYRFLPEFQRVCFKQFKERLRDHRKQVAGDLGRAKREVAAVAAHRLHFPRKTTTHKGAPVFDIHPAKELLREDVKQGNHVGVSPSALRLTKDEYQEFDQDIFRRRIYQEKRRKKFVNYLNEERKTKGKLLRCEPPPAELYDLAGDAEDDCVMQDE